jgi:hypothetical protein
MYKVWTNKLDNKYDVFVESDTDGYHGFLVIMDGDKQLLKEETSISYGARFGPDAFDVAIWEDKCCNFIDGLNKKL